jgi:hypothetical protein
MKLLTALRGPRIVAVLALLFIPPTSMAQSPPTDRDSSQPAPGAPAGRPPASTTVDFPDGTETPSELCGACHQAIYREFVEGFGADLQYGQVLYEAPGGKKILGLPANTSVATLHATAGVEPFPIHARAAEEEGRPCNVCHYPQAFEIPDIGTAQIAKPQPRPKGAETGGLTCASCHLTPDGKIRGPYDVNAPHATVRDPRIHGQSRPAWRAAVGRCRRRASAPFMPPRGQPARS